MKIRNDITAFILAGGKSSRMGTDKGLLPFQGKPMIQYIIEVLQQQFSSIQIISNVSGYTKFGFPVISDLIKDTGPIGGIYTGLMQSSTDWNFFTACDMPFLEISVIEKLTASTGNFDCVVATVELQPEPLCALYNKSCIPVINEMISQKNYKLQDLLGRLRITTINFNINPNNKSNPFRNLNTMKEFNLSEKHEG